MRVVGVTGYAESGKPQELLDKYGLTSAAVATAAREVLAARP